MTDYWFDRGLFGYSTARAKNIVTVVAPPVEPITVADLRQPLRMPVYGSPKTYPEDQWLTALAIPTARQWVEDYLRRSLVQRTLRISYDRFPREIELLMPPVRSVTSVTYTDTNGAAQTLAPDQYTVDTDSEPARIWPSFAAGTWPDTAQVPNAVQVTYVAGYAPSNTSPINYTANIPKKFVQSIIFIVGDLFANRERSNMMQLYSNETAEALLYNDRVFTL